MKKKQKITKIDTIACLKHKNSTFELHFKPDESANLLRATFPLNIFQVWAWRLLGFKYYDGVDYIQYMREKFNKVK